MTFLASIGVAGVGGDGGGKARSFLAFLFLGAQGARGRQQDRMITLGFGIFLVEGGLVGGGTM